MSTIRRVAKNSFFLFIGNNINKVFSFVLIIILARYLGVSNFGKLSFALSFTGLFLIFTDLGMRVFFKREVSRDLSKAKKYLSNVLSLKLILSVFTFILVFIVINLLNYPFETKYIVYLATIFIILQSYLDSFDFIFQAFEKMQYSSFLRAFRILIRLLLAIVIIWLGYGLIELMYVYIISSLISLFLSAYICIKKFTTFNFRLEKDFALNLLKRSIPFGIAGIFMTIYAKIDITMLSKLAPTSLSGIYSNVTTDTVIGWYSAAHNLLDSLTFIPLAFSAALAPIAARAFVDNLPRLKLIYEKSFTYITYITIPIVVGTIILADKIIDLIYGSEYRNGALALQILIVMIFFNFQVYTFGLALNSMNKEKITMIAAVLAVIVNVGLNFWLIPIYSFIGAAVTTIISEITYFVFCYYFTSKLLMKLNLIKITWKPLLSGLIMGTIIYYLTDFNLFLLIALGSILYIGLLFLFRAFTERDKEFVNKLIGRKISIL